jgi:hypothetical protein
LLPAPDPQLAALRRLIADAHQGGQAKVDALVALSQRTVFVIPWPSGIEGWRTLVNREGIAALPMFTDRSELEEAARRYGWLDARGEAPFAEVGARAAFNYAIREHLTFVVVDVASLHALEIGRAELEPLLTPAARRDSQGPYAGAGKISSSLIQAMRPTPAPGALKAVTDPPSMPGFTVSADFNASAKAATFGGGASVTIAPLPSEPSDELLDALTAVLREYPEVEWACAVHAARGPTAPVPTIGLRVDAGFRQRVNEIVSALRRTGDARGAGLDVILLDDAALMRSARGQGLVFYPWRKR